MTVAELFAHEGLRPSGPVRWGASIPCNHQGVYIVALDPDPACRTGLPVPVGLRADVATRWLAGHAVLYIGKAGGPGFKATIRTRTGQFRRHVYGRPKPHAGGEDVKLLLDPPISLPLWLFWSATDDVPIEVEHRMLVAFRDTVGSWPFANRQC